MTQEVLKGNWLARCGTNIGYIFRIVCNWNPMDFIGIRWMSLESNGLGFIICRWLGFACGVKKCNKPFSLGKVSLEFEIYLRYSWDIFESSEKVQQTFFFPQSQPWVWPTVPQTLRFLPSQHSKMLATPPAPAQIIVKMEKVKMEKVNWQHSKTLLAPA